jgi:hypothetical protein
MNRRLAKLDSVVPKGNVQGVSQHRRAASRA